MPYSILIVDDDEKDAKKVAEFFDTMIDAELDFADHRQQAWRMIKKNNYDVAIIDMDLKGQTEGRLLLESIRNRIDHPPGVIIISTLGHRPGTKELKAHFPFVTEVMDKREIEELPRTFKLALDRALGLGSGLETGSFPQVGPRPHSDKVLIIHGRGEAKWRELQALIKSEFGLTPVVLEEQSLAGSPTLIENFEKHACGCAYAIAIFTPEDEVRSPDGDVYLQARPNAIWELGWFCGYFGRPRVTLLLKSGTSIFSDFAGVVQRQFTKNVSECVPELRRDLTEAGMLKP